MKLSDSTQAFLLDKKIAGFSPNTIRNYTLTLKRLGEYLDGDPELSDITTDDVRAFLDHLMTTRIKPRGIAKRPERQLSAKTIKNIHTVLSSLWTWAVNEGHADTHVPRQIDVPSPSPPAIEPFTYADIKALTSHLSYSRKWDTNPDTKTERPRKRQLRDRAILLTLLDTGIRATELCELTLKNIDLADGRAHVKSKGRLDRGEGKERIVRFSPTTSRAISRYLAERDVLDRRKQNIPVFVDRNERAIDRHYLAKHLKRLGKRAGVPDCYPHRFRHTFAITYLRNGGDIYTLQMLLGHTSLEMVRRYLAIARVDVEDAHRRASPVDNWRL
jgi:integrase/recombinase XerD